MAFYLCRPEFTGKNANSVNGEVRGLFPFFHIYANIEPLPALLRIISLTLGEFPSPDPWGEGIPLQVEKETLSRRHDSGELTFGGERTPRNDDVSNSWGVPFFPH